MRRFYFAYGSNMLDEQILHRCPNVAWGGRGRLLDWSFLINERGVATIQREEGAITWGVVYLVTPLCIAYLDFHEGVKSGRYGKFYLPVETRTSEGIELKLCLVYIDPSAVEGRPRKGYLEKVILGARQNALPRSYIRKLKKWRLK